MNELNIDNLDSDIIEFTNNDKIYEEIKSTNKISQPYLTKYEYAKIVGIAAQQIESGRKPLVDNLPSSYTSPIDIAEYELKKKKTPIIIKRKLPHNNYEYWTLDQLII
tara:strand:+ start:8662 stop:8985 length:324 start_codon:yes stop_codon:yes gene_type:complete